MTKKVLLGAGVCVLLFGVFELSYYMCQNSESCSGCSESAGGDALYPAGGEVVVDDTEVPAQTAEVVQTYENATLLLNAEGDMFGDKTLAVYVNGYLTEMTENTLTLTKEDQSVVLERDVNTGYWEIDNKVISVPDANVAEGDMENLQIGQWVVVAMFASSKAGDGINYRPPHALAVYYYPEEW